MSISVENNFKELTTVEINELLRQLGLSPKRVSEEIKVVHNSSGQHQENEFVGVFSSEAITDCTRENLLEQLSAIKEDEKLLRMTNSHLQDRLEDYFKRKQLIDAVADEPTLCDNKKLIEYMKKLLEHGKIIDFIALKKEQSSKILIELNDEVIAKTDEVKNKLEKLIAQLKNVKKNSRPKIDKLIEKCLEKNQQVSKKRLDYANLRWELNNLKDSIILIDQKRPNLTKNDYEKLKAEKFYYQRKFKKIAFELPDLEEKNCALQAQIHHTSLSLTETINNIKLFQKILSERDKTLKKFLIKNKNVKKNLTQMKKLIRDKHSVNRDNLHWQIEKICKEHEKWMKKITKIFNESKNLNESLKNC